jgi:hypothetical protein
MKRVGIWSFLGAVVLSLVVAGLGCESSEVVAPEGSLMSLSAEPTQIILENGVQQEDVNLLATVRSSIGSPLKGQDVRFSTNSGKLTPGPGTPVATDSNGNAFSVLTEVTEGPTITATSGLAEATLTLTVGTVRVGSITLSPTPLVLNSCDDTLTLTVTVLDTESAAASGVRVTLEIVDTGRESDVTGGSFSPNPIVSDGTGIAETVLSLPNCAAECATSDVCTGRIRAKNDNGSVLSNEVEIADSINN